MSKGRTFVIGDIHGALKALEQVLKRSPYNPEKDTLIPLGDYVDGWHESAQVIQFLIDLSALAYNVIPIRGNHDVWCSEWLEYGTNPIMWEQQGGKATYESYMNTQMFFGKAGEKHKKFFRSMHNYYIDDENRGFVHGGFWSSKGLGHEESQDNYYWNRSLWQQKALSGERSQTVPKILKSHKEIFIGHTSTCNWTYSKPHLEKMNLDPKLVNTPVMTPYNACNVWNLDTGAGYSGKLTIMDVDSKEYWQSDLVKELYPNHNGR